jgi:hypothetical protein
MLTFSVTYEIVTEESASEGDAEERGWICEDVSLRVALRCVADTRTNQVDGVSAIECDESPVCAPRWVTVTNGMEYLTGAQESRSLHIPEGVTAASRRRIARLVGARVP